MAAFLKLFQLASFSSGLIVFIATVASLAASKASVAASIVAAVGVFTRIGAAALLFDSQIFVKVAGLTHLVFTR